MATAVIMPRQGQSVESCILVEWLVKAGDKVEQGTPLANIETDKAVFEVESPAAGTVLELFAEAGEDIPVLQNIAAVGDAGEDVVSLRPGGESAAASAQPAETATQAAPAPTPAAAPATPEGAAVGVSPRARSLAAKTGVAATALPGSGPGGRVIERDVAAAAAAAPRMTPAARERAAATGLAAPAVGSGPAGMVRAADLSAAAPATAGAQPAAAAASAAQQTTEIPLSGIRKIIAQRMKGSLDSSAQLTMTKAFNASAILAYRSRLKTQAENLGLPNITINDMILYATARTLTRFPELNAHFKGDKVVRYSRVNMGVAMDTPRGLMVPVLRNADLLSLAEISRQVKPMSDDARRGSINPDLLTGGTFTITNLGMMGIETFTPILNVPEVAILGVGGPVLRPVETPKGVEYAKYITLSLTVDHQAVDGGPGAQFLRALAESLENFDLLLAE